MESQITFWQAAALAFIQGVTEFVPVSSSGHLVLIRKFLDWSDAGGLAFDTVLHGGSLAALLVYFRRDCIAIIKALLSPVFRVGAVPPGSDPAALRRIAWLIAVATVPAAAAGVLLKPFLESGDAVRNLPVTGLSMLATAALFLTAESKKDTENNRQMTFPQAVLIGCAQVVALLPGASRSGWTMGAGMLCGQGRESSVRFSFLMAIPIVAGALLFQIKDIVNAAEIEVDPLVVAAGFVFSFAVSLGAIHFCISYFKKHTLKPFAVYLAAAGFAALLFFFLKDYAFCRG